MVEIAQEPLFQVFLDVQKAYNYLGRGQYMEILRGYGMGQNIARLIAHHCDNHVFFQRRAGF